MTENACAVYELRWNAEGLAPEVLKGALKEIGKKWIFQLEKGDSGYLHYQGRISLIKKRRKNELLNLFEKFEKNIKPNYCEPTVATNLKDFSYVMKLDTRVQGPWTDQDEETYIPRQFRGLMDRLYPYQKAILDSGKVFNDREINMIYCKNGNVGKSTTAALCELFGNAIDLPPVNDMKELIQICCNICMSKNIRNPSPIFIDLPRAMKKDTLFGMYSAVEQIKKGKLYDMRYHYKEWWIDSPTIWVFSNVEPNLNLLSRDRWKIWRIDPETRELKKYLCLNKKNGLQKRDLQKESDLSEESEDEESSSSEEATD